MYYTVWNTERRGHHKQNSEGDFLRVDHRKATQFPSWTKAVARSLELSKATGDHHEVRLHDWPGGTP